jgi:biofilm PGA synthesis protein PgaD
MKTNRSRHIIDSTKNLPLLVRIRDVILTILVWLLYLYFMRDFFAFISDVFDWSFHGFSNAEAYNTFKIMDTIVSYIEIIVVMEVLFVAWSFYNLLRFGKKTRRKAPVPVTTEDIAKKYSLNTQDVDKWQKARSMVMHHDKRGHLVEVEIT